MGLPKGTKYCMKYEAKISTVTFDVYEVFKGFMLNFF